MSQRELSAAALIAASIFALSGWLVVEFWIHPRALEMLAALTRDGIGGGASARRGLVWEHPVLYLAAPYLTIGAAQAVGGLALSIRSFRAAQRSKCIVLLVAAAVLGWMIAVAAFVPADLTSWLAFSVPAAALLLGAWIASLLTLAVRRRILARRRTP